ncbi:hypothetical protein ABZ782_27680 [Streptomyces asoensis]|uniref:hypothetical protein n=1 Tax=Streptomyces asoensis TaxID=249586 RepID=UPI0033EC6852
MLTVLLSQLAPFSEFVRDSCPDEVMNECPRAIDIQDEVPTERSQVIHDRDADHDVCCGGTVSDEQQRAFSVVEPMDHRQVTQKSQSQPGKLADCQPDFDVSPAAGAQFVEMIGEFSRV